MKRNPYIGRIKADKNGNLYFRKNLIPLDGGFTAIENLYLMFSVPSILKYCGKEILDNMVGSRTTQWRVRRSLKAKGYGTN